MVANSYAYLRAIIGLETPQLATINFRVSSDAKPPYGATRRSLRHLRHTFTVLCAYTSVVAFTNLNYVEIFQHRVRLGFIARAAKPVITCVAVTVAATAELNAYEIWEGTQQLLLVRSPGKVTFYWCFLAKCGSYLLH